MSFNVSISDVLIANEALAMLPAEPIVSMAELSLEARECRRAYKPVVAELLEMHHWGLATKRVQLAAIANTRSAEWAYAYAKPTDLAYPVSMVPDSGAGYFGWVLRDGVYWSQSGRRIFEQVGSTIFSGIDTATLEYTSFDITEADFTPLFKKVVVLELAARICAAVTKNSSRWKELQTLSEGWRMRIIANDMNRDQPTYGDRPTESEIVRFGGMADHRLIGGYALDPVANPSNTGY